LMRLMVLLFLGAFVIGASGSAEAKVAAYRLTLDGPGMESFGVIREGRLLDRASSLLLFRGKRARAAPPQTPGPAYVLAYRFGVHDEDGSRTETIHQTLYPFASGGPVVFTARRQRVDMTYGPVRFVSGWFRVPGGVLRKLQQAGLPAVAPEPELDMSQPTSGRIDATRSGWLWLFGVGALVTVAGTAFQRRRRSRARNEARAKTD
jgi:hypothetical protein